MDYLLHCLDIIQNRPSRTLSFGKVQSVIGLLVEASEVNAAVGELCFIYESTNPQSRKIKAEVVGVRGNISILMPMETTVGLKAGCLVERSSIPLTVQVGDALLGRVIDANGFPIDNLGSILLDHVQRVHREPPSPMERQLISEPLYTGVKAIDSFLTLGKGQRIGIFSGSGVGKSTLLGMIARSSKADVNVIGLIGERGREVQEFIVDNLGKEGLKRSVVVAVTGEQAAMHRVKGASITMAIAEFFRDQGKDVLLMMDSVTRVAMAQREIGLAIGEPPTTRGYTPSVFAMLPRLLERAGPGSRGTITGIFTVLIDSDDMNDPVGDAVRGILDGHIVLSRKLAQANHYPAIDVLQSVSRLMPRITSRDSQAVADRARKLIASYRDSEDLIRIGAYEEGTDPDTDKAIKANQPLNTFLQQGIHDNTGENASSKLKKVIQSLFIPS